MWKHLTCIMLLWLFKPAAALRPRDYSEELLAVNASSSMLANREQHCEICYKAILNFILNLQDWTDVLAIREAWLRDGSWFIDGLMEESIQDYYEEGALVEKDVALWVAISAIFNEIEAWDKALKTAAKNKVWVDTLVKEDSFDCVGSQPVTEFAHELQADQNAKLANGGTGSLLLAAWILSLLEDHFQDLLTVESANPRSLYNKYVKKARSDASAIKADADKLDADYQKLANIAGSIGVALSKVNNYQPLGMSATDEDKDKCLYEICQGVQKVPENPDTMFPSRATLVTGREYAGFATLKTAAAADRTCPEPIDIPDMEVEHDPSQPEGGDTTFYYRPSLAECTGWIATDYPED